MKNQQRWAAYVIRMDDNKIPKQCYYCELVCGKRPRHKPKKRSKKCIKNNLKSFKIPVDDWETLAMNHSEWRKSVNKVAEVFERELVDRAEARIKKRQRISSQWWNKFKMWNQCEIQEEVVLLFSCKVLRTQLCFTLISHIMINSGSDLIRYQVFGSAERISRQHHHHTSVSPT